MKNLLRSFGTLGKTSFWTLNMQSLMVYPFLTDSRKDFSASSFKDSSKFDVISFNTSFLRFLETKSSYPFEQAGPAFTVTASITK